jgi:hypothetical protein
MLADAYWCLDSGRQVAVRLFYVLISRVFGR